MPKSTPISLTIQCDQKTSTTDKLNLREWEKSDGMQRAVFACMAVMLMAGLMIPIPIVHFAAIPVVLLGLPLAGIITFKLYSKGTDLQGDLTCPECGHTRAITRSLSYWPLSIQCLSCKKHMTINRV